jgi:hypothetical protein
MRKFSRKNKRHAISAVVGTVIMFAMLLSVAGTYFYVVQNDQQAFQNSIAQDNQNLLNTQSQVHIAVFGISQSGQLAFYVNNTGISVSITSYWVLNASNGVVIEYDNSTDNVNLPFTVSQGQSATFISSELSPNIIIPNGAKYVIKILTSAGTQAIGTYPSQQVDSSTVQSLVAGGFGSLQISFSSFDWYSYLAGPSPTSTYNGNSYNNLCANSKENETNCNNGSFALDIKHPHSGSLVPGGYNATLTQYTTQTTRTVLGGLGLDGSTGGNTEGNSVSATLTTLSSNDVIILAAGTSSSSTKVNSVTDTTGLTWNHRATEKGSSSVEEEEWYAIANNPLSSDKITVTWSASGDNVFTAFGVSGAKTSSPFDSGTTPPAVSTGGGYSASVSVSTSNSNDFIFGLLANEHTSYSYCHTMNPGSGFTSISGQQAQGQNTCMASSLEYKTVTSTQNNLALSFSDPNQAGTNQWAEIGDAIVSGSSSLTTTTITTSSPTATTQQSFQVPIAFSVNVTNYDPSLATIVLNSASNLWVIETCDSGVTEGNCPSGNPFYVFYIMDVNQTTGAITSTSQGSFSQIVIPYGQTKTLYYGAAYDMSLQPYLPVGLTSALAANPFYYGQFGVFLLFAGTEIISPNVLVYGQNIPFESTTAADNFGYLNESPISAPPGASTTFALTVNDSIFSKANPTNPNGIYSIVLNASAFSSISVTGFQVPAGWTAQVNTPSSGYITWTTNAQSDYITNGTTDTFYWKGTAPSPTVQTQYIFPVSLIWARGQIVTAQSALVCTVS